LAQFHLFSRILKKGFTLNYQTFHLLRTIFTVFFDKFSSPVKKAGKAGKMKITRRARIKIRVREPVQNGKPEINPNCPLCGSQIQPPRPPAGTNKAAVNGSTTETAEQISRETENNKEL
jgi:hypothetical protein